MPLQWFCDECCWNGVPHEKEGVAGARRRFLKSCRQSTLQVEKVGISFKSENPDPDLEVFVRRVRLLPQREMSIADTPWNAVGHKHSWSRRKLIKKKGALVRESANNKAELTELSRERYKGAELGAAREGKVAGRQKEA